MAIVIRRKVLIDGGEIELRTYQPSGQLSKKEREWVYRILKAVADGDTKGMDIKRLKGRSDIFRVRKGDIRIIYRVDGNGKMFILAIERRKEDTYRL